MVKQPEKDVMSQETFSFKRVHTGTGANLVATRGTAAGA